MIQLKVGQNPTTIIQLKVGQNPTTMIHLNAGQILRLWYLNAAGQRYAIRILYCGSESYAGQNPTQQDCQAPEPHEQLFPDYNRKK